MTLIRKRKSIAQKRQGQLFKIEQYIDRFNEF